MQLNQSIHTDEIISDVATGVAVNGHTKNKIATKQFWEQHKNSSLETTTTLVWIMLSGHRAGPDEGWLNETWAQ